MGDACCSPTENVVDHDDESGLPWRTWAAATAAAAWFVGVLAGWAGAEQVATTAFIVAVTDTNPHGCSAL